MKLLHEIEQGAAGDDMAIGTLLRKSLILAHRLQSKPATDWVERELNGYGPDDEVPDYRKLGMVVKAHILGHSLHHKAWTVPPAILGDLAKSCDQRTFRESISKIERLVSKMDGKSSGSVSFDMGDLALLLDRNEAIIGNVISAWGEMDDSQLTGIVEAVRSRVLMFALNLEREYPESREIEATTVTKEKNQNVDRIVYNTFYGNGNVVGSSGSAKVATTVNTGKMGDLDQLCSVGLKEMDIRELKEALNAEPEAVDGKLGPKVKSWISKMVQKARDGVWSVAENVAGNIATDAVKKYYGLG